MSALHASRKLFLDAVKGLSDAQWNFKPGPDRWSIAECAEHITLSEESIMGLVRERVVKTPGDPAMLKQTAGKDDKVHAVITDRSGKAQAPEFLKPTGKWKTRDELIAAFKTSRDRNIQYIDTTTDNLRGHAAPHPAMGPLDAYQWVLLLAAHSERHTAQIREVMTDSGYPGK
jgi:uncharacterized damage-inducible protein DinB